MVKMKFLMVIYTLTPLVVWWSSFCFISDNICYICLQVLFGSQVCFSVVGIFLKTLVKKLNLVCLIYVSKQDFQRIQSSHVIHYLPSIFRKLDFTYAHKVSWFPDSFFSLIFCWLFYLFIFPSSLKPVSSVARLLFPKSSFLSSELWRSFMC